MWTSHFHKSFNEEELYDRERSGCVYILYMILCSIYNTLVIANNVLTLDVYTRYIFTGIIVS